ncbi:DUF4652 domain-containing protein [Peribacillus frigoritolerans]|uniref:DUF4652 domain-containing protein n=1 Tax=Peribacillus frigoritolerans TaxID=450367 RepID=UPI00342D8443
MYILKYDEVKAEIYQIDPNGKRVTISNDFPSKPIFSPDKKKAIYISPLEWECQGSLYLYNLENGTIEEIIAPIKQDIPKYALWIDNENIAVIIGFSYGTVSVGGNVYRYNVTNKALYKLSDYPNEIQITKLTKSENELELTGIKYIDKNMEKFIEFNDKLSLVHPTK